MCQTWFFLPDTGYSGKMPEIRRIPIWHTVNFSAFWAGVAAAEDAVAACQEEGAAAPKARRPAEAAAQAAPPATGEHNLDY